MNNNQLGEYLVLVDEVLNLHHQKKDLLHKIISNYGTYPVDEYMKDVWELDGLIESKMQRMKGLKEEVWLNIFYYL